LGLYFATRIWLHEENYFNAFFSEMSVAACIHSWKIFLLNADLATKEEGRDSLFHDVKSLTLLSKTHALGGDSPPNLECRVIHMFQLAEETLCHAAAAGLIGLRDSGMGELILKLFVLGL
jgi:hypothetical protein